MEGRDPIAVERPPERRSARAGDRCRAVASLAFLGALVVVLARPTVPSPLRDSVGEVAGERAGGPSGAASATPAADNLLLVSFDTTRADRLSAYGYGRPTSPHVDALAAHGVLFEHAYTHVPSTLPAHASMMTGLLPPVHGVRCNGKFRLPARARTLAERLAAGGFATAAIVGGFPLDPRFGLAQGFESYDADFGSDEPNAVGVAAAGFWIGHEYDRFERPAREVTDRAIAWLARRDTRRWFLFAHYFDPHWPYEPGDPWRTQFDDPYDGELATADHELGRLLEAVDRMPGRTLVVFTADHGEGLGDHGEAHHNRYLYDATLRVPLVMALEGRVKPGLRITANVGHVDLLPTILDLVGVPAGEGLDGRSFAQALVGGELPADAPLYAETLIGTCERTTGIELRSLLDGPWKLVRTTGRTESPELELYDRRSDPTESHNLAVDAPDAVARIRGRLDERRADLLRRALVPEALPFDEETKVRLRGLGYL